MNKQKIALVMLLACSTSYMNAGVTNKLAALKDWVTGKKPELTQEEMTRSKLSPDPTKDPETRAQLIDFLSKDPNYSGKRNLQKGFLDRFNMTETAKQQIIKEVAQKELTALNKQIMQSTAFKTF